MTDPNTIASLADEFDLQPDTVRLIMDAAEQHPGVVDPIALGRSWLRKRVEAERHSQPGQPHQRQSQAHRLQPMTDDEWKASDRARQAAMRDFYARFPFMRHRDSEAAR